MGLTSSQGVARDEFGVEIHLAANQPMGPHWIKLEGAAEEMDLPLLGCTTKENDTTLQRRFKIQLPTFGKGSTLWGSLHPYRRLFTTRYDVLGGTTLEGLQRLMLESSPDLGLPASVETLDSGLETALMGWCKHRHNTETQA